MRVIKPKHYFLEHEQMDFETQILLGCCHYGAADAGEILAAVERIPSGDFEQWYQEWFALAERLQGIAEQCASAGHSVSARKAFLRAATYFSASAIFIDGTKDPARGLPAWKQTSELLGAVLFLLDPTGRTGQNPLRRTLVTWLLIPSRPIRRPLGHDYL